MSKNPNEFRKNKCPHCGKRFTKMKLLLRHQTTHEDGKKFRCSNCPKLFKAKSSVQRHELHTHKGIKDHKCGECDASFSQNANLIRHIKRLHSSRPKKGKQNINKLSKSESSKEDAGIEDPNKLAQLVVAQLKSLEMEIPSHLNTVVIDEHHPKEETKTLIVKTTKKKKESISYICEYCAKMFKKSYDLKRHVRTHNNERPFSCSNCSKCFGTKSKLHEHFKRIHILDEKKGLLSNNHECCVCNKIFDSIRQLDFHMRSHKPNHSIQFQCSTCNAVFRTMAAFSAHKHNNKDLVMNMIEHLLPKPFIMKPRNESNIINFKCPSCGLVLKDENALKRHTVRHDMMKKFKCNICGRSYVSNLSLRVHLKTHSVTKTFTCNICQTKHFPTASQLQRHKMYVHENIRRVQCVYCPKFFKNQAHCKSHMRSHIKKLLETKETDINPPEKSALKGTAIIKTDGVQSITKAMEIEVLPKYLQYKQQNIKIDMNSKNLTITKSTRSTKSQHICKHCTKSFQKSNDLSRHLRTHTEERPFKCGICMKYFKLKSTLEDHKQTHQNILERSKTTCQVCGKSYASLKSLTVHLRIHTGHFPFKCDNCGKAFRTSGHRLSHMRAAKDENGQCKNMKSINNLVFLNGL